MPGSSSGFSIFSPQGLQWISERTGNTELKQYIKSVAKAHKATKISGKVELWSPMPASAREPLPPKDVADPWIRCKRHLEHFASFAETRLGFFETFNTMLPLYDRDLFEQYYTRQYTASPPSGPAWYASINVVMAIGGMISEVHSQVEGRGAGKSSPFQMNFPEMQDSLYSKYYRNATSCFLDLTFNEPSLMAVQAICGLVGYASIRICEIPSNINIGVSTTNELTTTSFQCSHMHSRPYGLLDWPASESR